MEATKIEAVVGAENFVMQTGVLAKQANGAVVCGYGDSVVLCTATSGKPREGIDFFPLTVMFEEKMYAAGKMPGGFFKREGRPSDHATLSARQTDRPIRPLFPAGFKDEIQIVITALSSDMIRDIDVVGLVGASAALMVSDIPFDGPVAAVRVGRVNGALIVNPTFEETQKGELNLVVAGTRDAITMVEGEADGVSEDEVLDALDFGFKAIQPLIDMQFEMVQKAGKPKYEYAPDLPPAELVERMRTQMRDDLYDAVFVNEKKEREAAMGAVYEKHMQPLVDDEQVSASHAKAVFKDIQKQIVRQRILDEGVRPDGRKMDEVRPVHCEVGFLPRTHGSALFTRGQTQALTVATLAGRREDQIIDGITFDRKKRFLHQYNFPPYCVGEVKPIRGPSRRDIGHGQLAESAMERMIPEMERFPYVIRLVSEILESNGSSSMAAVCGSTLALMDAGVPIKSPVAGIAMGLITGDDGKYRILTDIQGMEDFLGDMDFKLAGPRDGITALQMDIKIQGLNREILKEALYQARQARLFILDRMLETLAEPRSNVSSHAPKILTTTVPCEKIGDVIGPGGRIIRGIIERFNVDVDVEDDGSIYIIGQDHETTNQALEYVSRLTRAMQPGEMYTGQVVRILNFGAFVEIMPGRDGLVHISQIAENRIDKVEDVLTLGQQVVVKVKEIDDQGRINLTMKGVDQSSVGG